jgi:hypothetical protein
MHRFPAVGQSYPVKIGRIPCGTRRQPRRTTQPLPSRESFPLQSRVTQSVSNKAGSMLQIAALSIPSSRIWIRFELYPPLFTP